VLILAGIDDPNLIALPPILLPRLTACLAVSSVIPGTLRRRLYGWSGSTASVRMLRFRRYPLVGSRFRAETRKTGFGPIARSLST